MKKNKIEKKEINSMDQWLAMTRPKVDDSVEPKAEPKANSRRFKLKKFHLHIHINIKKILLVILTIILLFSSLVFFVFSRQKQLCQYQTLVDNGEITAPNGSNLCPNLLDSKAYGKIISNGFNFGLQKKLKINPNFAYSGQSSDDINCTDQLSPVCWLKQLKGNVKQTDGFTNVLIVGSDTRNGKHLTGNTDTIIFASYQHSTGELLMISLPRDLLVLITSPMDGHSKIFARINAIYAIYNKAAFNNAISEIIGRPIHYYVYLSFDAFNTVIDKLGGVNITLSKPFSDVYPCAEIPSSYKGKYTRLSWLPNFCLFEFPAGKNHFNRTQALVYSRARELSTDWDRSRRQQEVITAVLNQALHKQGSLKDKFNFYIEVYNQVIKQVDTNIKPEDLAGIFKIFGKISGNSAKVVVDPNFAGGSVTFSAGVVPGYGDIQKFRDYTYKTLRNNLNIIWKFLPYYIEGPRVLVVNASGKPISAKSDVGKFIRINNPYWKLKVITDAKKAYTGLRIYDLSSGKKTGSLRDVQTRLKGSLLYNAQIEGLKKTSFKEDILIVVGK